MAPSISNIEYLIEFLNKHGLKLSYKKINLDGMRYALLCDNVSIYRFESLAPLCRVLLRMADIGSCCYEQWEYLISKCKDTVRLVSTIANIERLAGNMTYPYGNRKVYIWYKTPTQQPLTLSIYGKQKSFTSIFLLESYLEGVYDAIYRKEF